MFSEPAEVTEDDDEDVWGPVGSLEELILEEVVAFDDVPCDCVNGKAETTAEPGGPEEMEGGIAEVLLVVERSCECCNIVGATDSWETDGQNVSV